METTIKDYRIGRASYASGEVVYNYYFKISDDSKTITFWKLCDWVDSTPQEVSLDEIKEQGLFKKFIESLSNLEC